MRLQKVLNNLNQKIEADKVQCKFCNRQYVVEYEYGEIEVAYECEAFSNKKCVIGGYGSTVCDGQTFYWKVPPTTTGRICDTCILSFVKSGDLVDKIIKSCAICEKDITTNYYTRRGSKIVYSKLWNREEWYYPFSDKYTLSDKEIYWCEKCAASKNLIQLGFDYSEIEDRIKSCDPKDIPFYKSIRSQMVLKKQVTDEIKKVKK